MARERYRLAGRWQTSMTITLTTALTALGLNRGEGQLPAVAGRKLPPSTNPPNRRLP